MKEVHIVRCRPKADIFQILQVLITVDLLKVLDAAQTVSCVKRCKSLAFLTGLLIPRCNLARVCGQHVKLEFGPVIRMKSWEALVADSALKQKHVTEDSLRREHPLERGLVKLGVVARCADWNSFLSIIDHPLWGEFRGSFRDPYKIPRILSRVESVFYEAVL